MINNINNILNKLIVRLIPLESFELKKVHSKGLKECDYTIYMDMNITRLYPKRT